MWFPFRRKAKKKPVVPRQRSSLTEGLIISMVANGMSYEEIRQAFPDLDENRIKVVVKRGLAQTGLFPD